MIKFKLLFAFICLASIVSCSNDDTETPALSDREMSILTAALKKIGQEDIHTYTVKLKQLSEITLPYQTEESVKELKEYQELYGWIEKNDIYFPALIYHLIVNEKITGEEKSNTNVLLWDLAETKFPNITDRFKAQNNFNSLDLIRQLLTAYE